MKYLGIDYGSKRVGLALSDESGTLAFPHSIVPNDTKLLETIASIAQKEAVAKIVMGESKDFSGKENKIMEEVISFVNLLKEKTDAEIVFEPEFLTSHQAERFQGKTNLLDASAAAIILQSYLDKKLP